MNEFIKALSVRFYRGIGNKRQFITPLSRINLLIGPNNSGKSIILNLISKHTSGEKIELTPEENYIGEESGLFEFCIGYDKEEVLSNLKRKSKNVYLNYDHARGGMSLYDSFDTILDIISKDGFIYLKVSRGKTVAISNNMEGLNFSPETNFDRLFALDIPWRGLFTATTNRQGGDLRSSWVPGVLNSIQNSINTHIPKVYIIPAKRELGKSGEKISDLSGRGLIDHLANLQNPPWDKQEEKKKFERINKFLRDVIGKDDVILEIPSNRESIQVSMDGKVLPLSSLGTGIHEVILIASFCTIFDGSIMCIEEPEIHLHPLLQKKLIRYLSKNTSCQYFIATHSNSFIDAEGVHIFRVSNDSSTTTIQAALTKDSQREILDDLGCNASDILQSNYVIWVEGPSDRIYLNHWIRSFDNRLVESIHYTIMFYGGALVRHLTASDFSTESFIKLRDLNRNMAIIFDSDKKYEEDPLKPNVERIVSEMNSDQCMAWVTKGREIENYIHGIKIQEALKSVHSRLYESAAPTGQFDNSFYFYTKQRNSENNSDTCEICLYKNADKVSVAHNICESPAELDILDLREKISSLCEKIYFANNIENNPSSL